MNFQKKDFRGQIKASSIRVDITDIGEQGYRGFFLKDSEIIDRLEAKINLIESEGEQFLWISLDECSLRTRCASIVISKISEALKIPFTNIMMACVHTHSGHNAAIDLVLLANKLLAGIASAKANLTIVANIRQTIGNNQNIVNRRVDLPNDLGGYCVMFNDLCKVNEDNLTNDATDQVVQFLKKTEGENNVDLNKDRSYLLNKNFDHRIHLWELLDINNKSILAVVRVNAHPVIVSQSRVGAKLSADYVRVLEKLIEADLGCTCSLFNGAFGDTRPLTNNYSFEDREKFAKKYYSALKNGIVSTTAIMGFSWLQFNDVKVQLREEIPRTVEEIKKMQTQVLQNIQEKIGSTKRNYDLLETVGTFLSDENKRPSVIVYNDEIAKGYATYQFNGWVIGPMKILALPGEPLTVFAASIEKETGVLPIGLANGYLSYLPDGETLKQGGYEANQCVLSENGLKELVALGKYFK